MKLLMAEHTYFDAFCQVGCHHLAKGLADQGHDIFYISAYLTPLHFLHYFTRYRTDVNKRFSNWVSGGKKWNEKIYSYVPFSWLPFTNKRYFDQTWIANHQFEWTFPSLKNQIKGDFDALLIGDPRFLPLLNQIKAPVKIFRLTDDALNIRSTPKSVENLLKIGLPQCDHVIVTAKRLVQILKDKFDYTKAIYMPNGVDLADFTIPRKEPPDFVSIAKPRVIYAGALDERIDLKLLETCARRLPSVSFILIGPDYCLMKKLKWLPNVHILGPRPYIEIAHYFSACQAAIIPFVQNKQTHSMCSIKLLQYLAAGLPTVCTRLDELASQKAPVYLAETEDEFVSSIQTALSERGNRESYIQFASQFSWKKNVQKIEELIASKNGSLVV